MLRSWVQLKSLVVFLIVFVLVVQTPILFASEYSEVCREAEMDAQRNVNLVIWAIPGFLCGVFGFAAAVIYDSPVPAEALVGKSSDYVRDYSSCYRRTAKNRQITGSCVGWSVGAIVSIIIYSITLSAVSSEIAAAEASY